MCLPYNMPGQAGEQDGCHSYVIFTYDSNYYREHETIKPREKSNFIYGLEYQCKVQTLPVT